MGTAQKHKSTGPRIGNSWLSDLPQTARSCLEFILKYKAALEVFKQNLCIVRFIFTENKMRNRSGKEMCEHGETCQDTSDKRDTGHWKEVSDSRTLADILKRYSGVGTQRAA